MATPQSTAALNALWITGYVPTQTDFQNLFASFPNIVDGNLLINSDVAITAHAGGGQGSAYAVTKQWNQITTCATAGDSLVLPAALAGRSGFIFNSTSTSADIFPATGEYFSNSSPNIAQALAGAYCLRFYCVQAGVWNFQLLSNDGLAQNFVRTIASVATLDTYLSLANVYTVTALATNMTISAPQFIIGSGQMLTYAIKDNGTARTLTWNAIFSGIANTLPTTTIAGKTMYLQFIYNAATTKWDLINFVIEGYAPAIKRVYRALITQAGTAAPTAVILENTLGVTPTYSRTGAGHYRITSTGLFVAAKLWYQLNLMQGPTVEAYMTTDPSNNFMTFDSSDDATVFQDDIFADTPMEIYVYP